MRHKVTFTLLSIVVIMMCLVIILTVRILPLLTSTNSAVETATLFALDHTPLQHVQSAQIYTGEPMDVTVTGTDALGRELYVFVRNQQATIVYKSQTVSQTRAIQAVEALHKPITRIVSALPGIVDKSLNTPLSTKASGNAVWQITAHLTNGGYLFTYVDMYTGRLLFYFQTNHFPQVG